MDQPRHASAGPPRQQERGPKAKLWVLDGRIYNYAKPGATQVCGLTAGSGPPLLTARLPAKLRALSALPGAHTRRSWAHWCSAPMGELPGVRRPRARRRLRSWWQLLRRQARRFMAWGLGATSHNLPRAPSSSSSRDRRLVLPSHLLRSRALLVSRTALAEVLCMRLSCLACVSACPASTPGGMPAIMAPAAFRSILCHAHPAMSADELWQYFSKA